METRPNVRATEVLLAELKLVAPPNTLCEDRRRLPHDDQHRRGCPTTAQRAARRRRGGPQDTDRQQHKSTMALEPGAMMKLRRELLLLRDGTAQETEIRTNKIAQLGRALEACAARRQFRGHETAVRTVAAGLLRHAAARADDECWSGADAEFYKSYARALNSERGNNWELVAIPGYCGAPWMAGEKLESRAASRTPTIWRARARCSSFRAIMAGRPLRSGGWSKLHLGKEGGGPERRSVVLRVAMLYQHALDQHGQAAALIFRLAENGGVPLFSNADLLFLLARAYEDWSRTLAERRGSAEKRPRRKNMLPLPELLLKSYIRPTYRWARSSGEPVALLPMRTPGCTMPLLGGL